MRKIHTCALCEKPPTSRGAKYCQEHRSAWRLNQKVAAAEFNRKRWEQWRAAGIDPTHGGEAAERRGSTIAESNREKPRRKANNEP